MGSIGYNVRMIVLGLAKGIVGLLLHPSLLTLLAFAAAVTAAYLQWGRVGGLIAFAVLAWVTSMANAKPPTT
jgi:hypothetical protein